jgi:hypothetical protein
MLSNSFSETPSSVPPRWRLFQASGLEHIGDVPPAGFMTHLISNPAGALNVAMWRQALGFILVFCPVILHRPRQILTPRCPIKII